MKCLNRRKFFLLLTCSFSAACGCGTETYNHRLEETRKLFNYINRLNENLGPMWNNSGVEIRMPRQLTEIPPPAMEINKETGEMVQIGIDERQPQFSSEELPGLIGAWKGNVEAEVAGQDKPVPAYAYILSNAYLWGKGEPEDAAAFKDTAAAAVMDGLKLPLYEETDWKREDYPESSSGFIPQQSANVWVAKSDAVVDENAPNLRYEASLHLFKNGDIQVAVLFVYPANINPHEHMSDRIGMALETIKISDELPKGGAATTGQSGGGARPSF